jgi:hypothetical protein
MKKTGKLLTRSLLTLAIAGFGLALTPRTASADFVNFTVNEAVVPGGTLPTTFTANKLSGAYTETLTLTPSTPLTGTFTSSAFATFTGYFIGGLNCGSGANPCGGVPIPSQISASSSPTTYDIIATLTASGGYALNGGVFGSNPACTVGLCFYGTSGLATMYLDPLQNQIIIPGDQILSSNTLLPGSGGQTNNITLPSTGNFNLNFGNIVLTALGASYWPTLNSVFLTSTVNGDFDAVGNTLGPQTLSGDVSAQFAVPEPGTLTLLGFGLSGLAAKVRRKRQLKTLA